MMRRIKKVLLGLVLVLVVVCVVLAILNEPMPDHPFVREGGVEVIAHRGGWGLWPENTLFAFQNAVDLGVDMLELDIRGTKDGHIVVFHDSRLRRTTNGTGRVNEFTLEELKKLDAGYQWSPDDGKTFPFRGKGIEIPTLKEVFESFPEMRMSIEIKDREPQMVTACIDFIRKYGVQDRILVASFESGTLGRFREQIPEVATSPGLTEGAMFYLLCRLHLSVVYHPNAEVLQFPVRFPLKLDTKHPALINGAHENNMQVQIWTVDDKSDMKLLIERGVNGIITRRPDRLLKLLGRLPQGNK